MGPVLELKTIALHGFLGRASDWEPVQDAAKMPIEALAYTETAGLRPQDTDLASWGRAFITWLDRTTPQERPVLLGYSQGGRLALSAFRADPERFAGLVLLSTNPGFAEDDLKSREARVKHDESWARRFEQDPWSVLMKDWNSQSVFAGGGVEPERPESSQARENAASSLRSWSLAKQPDQRDLIRKFSDRILLVSGERDPKYRELAESTLTSSERGLSLRTVPMAGHRLLFDAPREIGILLREFLLQNQLRGVL